MDVNSHRSELNHYTSQVPEEEMTKQEVLVFRCIRKITDNYLFICSGCEAKISQKSELNHYTG